MIEAPTYTATIFIAGDYALARQRCQLFAMDIGICVTVEPTEYIYKGGSETGVRVGLINYPRFPAQPEEIFAQAWALARALQSALAQWSFTIVATDKTVFETARAE